MYFANWVAFQRARKALAVRPVFGVRRLAALAGRAWNRLKFAREAENNSVMTMEGHASMGISLSPRAFMDVCLKERRMSGYDRRLLRPRFVPAFVRAIRPLVGRA